MRQVTITLCLVFLALLQSGCFGGSRATGKYSHHDKPKPTQGP